MLETIFELFKWPLDLFAFLFGSFGFGYIFGVSLFMLIENKTNLFLEKEANLTVVFATTMISFVISIIVFFLIGSNLFATIMASLTAFTTATVLSFAAGVLYGIILNIVCLYL